jgi:macrolide transport system ATP-binding/permease protein
MSDLRLALRRLWQQPGFTCVAVLTLALGLGANTAVFTLVHALMLRTLPVERPHELYRLGNTTDCCVNTGFPGGGWSLFSYPLFEHLKANTPEFTELAAFQPSTLPMGVRRAGDAVAASMPGAFVTGNYFTMFGVQPAAGRMLREDDDRAGAAAVAVMSHRAWSQQYARDPKVIGETFMVNGKPVTIVGVSAEPFFGDTIRPDPAAIWIPIGQEPAMRGAASVLDRAESNWLYAIGRATGAPNTAALSARVTASLQQWLSAQTFITDRDRAQIPRQSVVVAPSSGGVELARLTYERSLNLLFAASAMVLLIGAANLANLLLARADRGQAAIRAALGASGGRLVRQALAEGVVLALLGGAVGIVVAILSAKALLAIVFPGAAFVPVDATPSFMVLLFALGLALVTGVLFSAMPAWAMSRTRPLEALSGVGRSVHQRSFVPRGSLLVVQVALSIVLISSAGLLGSSLSNLERQPLGFVPDHRFVAIVDPPAIAGEIERLTNLYARFDQELRRIPGIERVAFAMYSPMEGNNWSSGISIAGRPVDPERTDGSSWNRVSAGYFDVVGTKVLQGRGIDERDVPGAKRVAVVNQSFVRRFFDQKQPIGQTVGIGGQAHNADYEIVGVTEDVKYSGAAQTNVRPMLFLPAFQTVTYDNPSEANVQARATLLRAIVVRASPSATGVEAGIRKALAVVDPNLNVMRVRPMDVQVSGNFRMQRVMARLTSVYGVLALALAALGLYGVTAYGVTQRTREIGVRMALGADRGRIIRTFLRGPIVQTLIGMAIGLPGAIFAGRALEAQLFGLGGQDPTVLAVAAITLMLAALAAAALPARRAASVNPTKALRGE